MDAKVTVSKAVKLLKQRANCEEFFKELLLEIMELKIRGNSMELKNINTFIKNVNEEVNKILKQECNEADNYTLIPSDYYFIFLLNCKLRKLVDTYTKKHDECDNSFKEGMLKEEFISDFHELIDGFALDNNEVIMQRAVFKETKNIAMEVINSINVSAISKLVGSKIYLFISDTDENEFMPKETGVFDSDSMFIGISGYKKMELRDYLCKQLNECATDKIFSDDKLKSEICTALKEGNVKGTNDNELIHNVLNSYLNDIYDEFEEINGFVNEI